MCVSFTGLEEKDKIMLYLFYTYHNILHTKQMESKERVTEQAKHNK